MFTGEAKANLHSILSDLCFPKGPVPSDHEFLTTNSPASIYPRASRRLLSLDSFPIFVL